MAIKAIKESEREAMLRGIRTAKRLGITSQAELRERYATDATLDALLSEDFTLELGKNN